MKYQQANPVTNEEFNLNTDGNDDSKAADRPGGDAIVNAETGDKAEDESLTTVRAYGLNT
jgi:hypothetical protein